MDQKEILLTVAKYIVHQDKNPLTNDNLIAGLLGGEHYFSVGGKWISEDEPESPFGIFQRWAVDIIADRIQHNDFFAFCLDTKDRNHYQATLDRNAKIESLESRETVTRARPVLPKGYLDPLRSLESFLTYSREHYLCDRRAEEKIIRLFTGD